MNKYTVCLVAALAAVLCSFGTVKETSWAKIEYPEKADGPFEVKVTLKDPVPAGVDVSTHLHYMKKDGYGGFLSWHKHRPAKAGQTATFKFKPPSKDGMSSIDAVVFLAPAGDFNKQVKNVHVSIPWSASGKAKAAASDYPAKPDTVTFKKSYIWLEEAPKPTRAGEDLVLRIHYKLDASDTWGDKPTQMMCMPLGPWIDNPDGVVNKKRQHVGYPGLHAQHQPVEVGDHVVEFRYRLKKTFRYNGCSFLCKFKQPNGADWPWEWRGGGMKVVKTSETFYLEPTALGGLFKYGETPEIKIGWGPKASTAKSAKMTVRDVDGNVVLEKSVACDSTQGDQTVKLDGLKVRGCFSATLSVEGVGEDYCYFGTIPHFVREKGRDTPFGVTNIYDEDFAKIASELGFSFTRLFTGWKGLEPSPGKWSFEEMDRTISLNSRNGLKPWVCLISPPAWALPEGMWSAGFEPSPFDLKAWGNAVTVIGTRYRDALWGFEWLNEIVPGTKCKDPVAEYVAICRAGYLAAKAVNPKFVCQLAGGLWPHNYRIDCLNAGVGEWVDVLPVHYSTYEGIVDAKFDLDVRDVKKVHVADNETASGMSVWNMDAKTTLAKSVGQCRHVMTRWPDELCAGSLFIAYFGGSGDPCGNWSYMLDTRSPRPVAVTLGVVQNKIGYAQAVGKFFVDGLPVQLFERDGKAIAFVCAPGREGVSVKLPAKGSVVVTDYMGNESQESGGVVTASDMPVIVEGLDLDLMKLHAALRVGTSKIPAAEPQVVVEASEKMPVPVAVHNPYGETRTFTLSPRAAEWWIAKNASVTLGPNESKSLEIFYVPKAGAKTPALTKLAVVVSAEGVQSVEKPFLLYAIDTNSIGNLLKNGGFEEGQSPWGGKNAIVDAPDASGKALVLKGTGKNQYKSSWQTVDLPVPGQSYLYTCWMWGDEQGGGSNIGEHFSDGTKTRNYYMPRVFSMGSKGSSGWRFMVKRFDSQANTKALTLTPVADGSGKTYYDNISLSLYRGTDFAAFAGRRGGAAAPSPVPLCCDNQVSATGGYQWSPKTLAGVASFTWDDEGLTLACSVADDVSAPKAIVSSDSSGEEALTGDMLALAVFPKIGPDGNPEPSQLRWYMSLANPGGGSGATTLFRPKAHSLGQKSGQLAKDSSVYQVNFRREGGRTLYDLKIPWTEIPGFLPAKGASFGCNLVLVDSDGGPGLGRMVWGADLGGSPSGCGILTLLP